jgi:glycosyltransferase involved in cell wall biosynthesis
MKFAILTDTLPPTIGGMQTITHELIKEFSRQKKDFVVITTERNAEYAMSERFYPELVTPAATNARDHNLGKLRKIGMKENIGCVLATDAGYASLSKFFPDIPFVVMLNGNDWLYPYNAFTPESSGNGLHDCRRAIASGFSSGNVRFIANSQLTRDLFCMTYRYPRDQVKVSYYGLPPYLTETLVPDAIKPSVQFRILTAARLDANAHRKNIYNLIDAIKILWCGPGPFPAKLTIMGSGDMQSVIQDHINRENLDDIVKIVSDAPYMSSKWFECYLKSDIFVMVPTEYEGFGLVYLEAQAFGMPVIARNPEVFAKGMTGILCEDTSSGGLATVIASAAHANFDRQIIHNYAASFTIQRYAARLYAELGERYDCRPLQ